LTKEERKKKLIKMGSGSNRDFSAQSAPKKMDSPLKGKKVFWLGSSVTAGLFSYGEAVPEFLATETGLISKKDAVSGTTLRQEKEDDQSYVSRLKGARILDPRESLDAFICQLSTNDAWEPEKWGDIRTEGPYDPRTTLGAIQTIVEEVRKRWACPIYFYSGSFYADSNGKNYALLVTKMQEISALMQAPFLDLFSDQDFNARLPLPRKTLMHDGIHPYRAGYELWWTPAFERFLLLHLKNGHFE
jgi:lysophospholipase L1-like esterase